MAELVSMKQTKKDRAAQMEPESLATRGPAYPYGLSLTFDDDVFDKLGLTIDDFTVGASMTLIAKVDVTAVSSQESTGQDAHQTVSLQITDLCLETGASKAATAAEALYGKQK